MSVSRGDSEITVDNEVDRYGELRRVHHASTAQIYMDSTIGPDLPEDSTGQQAWQYFSEPPLLGSLQRNQIAEVVDVIHQYSWMGVLDTQSEEAGAGSAYFDGELWAETGVDTDRNEDTITENDLSVEETPSNDFQESFQDGNSKNTKWEDTAHLHGHAMTVKQSFNDTTNSLGGGGHTAEVGMERMAYRDWYGRGPFVDRDTDLKFGGALQWRQIYEEPIRLKHDYLVTFDVYEYEQTDPVALID